MNTSIRNMLIILFSALCFSCSDVESRLDGMWISYSAEEYTKNAWPYDQVGKFDVQPTNKSPGLYLRNFNNSELLYVTKDSLKLNRYHESGIDERALLSNVRIDSIELCNDSLDCGGMVYSMINSKEISTPFFKNNKSRVSGDFEMYYRRIEQFKMKQSYDSLLVFLTSHPFRFDDKPECIEFETPYWNHLGKMRPESIGENYGKEELWYLSTLGDELFLYLRGELIHIKGFDEKAIYGQLHDGPKKDIALYASKYKDEFVKEEFIGNWTAVHDSMEYMVNPFMRLDYRLAKTNVLENKLELKINEQSFIITMDYYSDTLKWEMNKFHSKIMFLEGTSNYSQFMYLNEDKLCFNRKQHWEVKELSESELVIRKLRDDYIDEGIETITFKKDN